MRVMRRCGASMVFTREDDIYCFPLCWTEDPMAMAGFEYEFLAITKKEVVYLLDEFSIMSSRETTKLDR